MTSGVERIGPLLFFRGHDTDSVRLAALLIQPTGTASAVLTASGEPARAEVVHELEGYQTLRYCFDLPCRDDAGYWLDDDWYPVRTATAGDLRIAFVSCDGQERGDLERDKAERNRLWHRLVTEHEDRPFQLLLQGGDQLYADEMLDADPDVQAWGARTEAGAQAEPSPRARERLRTALFQRYLTLFRDSPRGHLMAQIPSLCIWDDHDICDGWGSLDSALLDAPRGQLVFSVAREFFRLFQLGLGPDETHPLGANPNGATLGWATHWPGVSFVAPDLRSERRPDQILGAAGWQALRHDLARSRSEQVFVLSSVPALGPRLSWVEALLRFLPRIQQYEDDLRDQWQSRTHREEWRTLLRELLDVHERGSAVTLLSGEIHLATRATLASDSGPLHQLIASGITHPPPPNWYARCLGALAHLGEAPLAHHPIRLHPLPGQTTKYSPQRNYLILERTGGHWHSYWSLEHDGRTPALSLAADPAPGTPSAM